MVNPYKYVEPSCVGLTDLTDAVIALSELVQERVHRNNHEAVRRRRLPLFSHAESRRGASHSELHQETRMLYRRRWERREHDTGCKRW